MRKLVIDFETFFDRKAGYCLGKKGVSVVEYIRDPRFRVHGVGVQATDGIGGAVAEWVSGKDVQEFFSAIDWANTAIVGHNVKFDGFILRNHYGIRPAQWIDTLGMSRAVLGKTVKSHSLAYLAEYYGFAPKGFLPTDGVLDLSPELEKEVAAYCLHDVELCAKIYERLAAGFPFGQYDPLHWTVRTFVEPKLKLNVGLLQQTAKEEAERKAAKFAELNIDKKVFSSNDKFADLLRAQGFEVPMKKSPRTEKQIPALALGDVDFLEMLESEDEKLRTLCEARVAAKSNLLETRSGRLAKLGLTGLWPFDVEFSGASQTHRFSGGSGAGGNPQNFTRGSALRKAVEALPGDALVCGDFSNIELRLVAYMSQDPGLLDAINRDLDLYCDFAGAHYGRKITKEDELERRFGKCAILGLGYGMGPKKFARTVRIQTGENISQEESERAVDLYRTRYRRVPALWNCLDNSINLLTGKEEGQFAGLPVRYRHREIVLPSGLTIKFPNLRLDIETDEWIFDAWGKNKTKPDTTNLYGGKLLENISQGLAGELCKEVTTAFGDTATGVVHDEIHLVCKSALSWTYAERLKKQMTTAPKWLPKLKLKAEVGIGSNWLDAK
jgi:DNA polymerase III epsilon subunit-like protein